MKKIKKFRVQSRTSAVLRGLKALTGDTRATPELEKAVDQEIQNAQDYFSTAALYSTYTGEQSPSWALPLWETKNEAGAKPVALTVFTATIGAALEHELSDSLSRGETLRGQILTCLGEESAEQAANFVYRLLQEEAKDESCELSPRLPVADSGHQREILSLLEAEKIPITSDDAGRLSPKFSRAGYILWWPPAKRRGAK